MRTCERGRGIEPGHVRPSLAIETPRGPLQSEAIAGSGPRIATMGVGVEDYCLELGVEPSPDGVELLYAVSRVVTICKTVGIQPTGLLGIIANFRDLAAFETAATHAPARLQGRGLHSSCPGRGAQPRLLT